MANTIDNFVNRLRRLSSQADSIQSLSSWLILKKRFATELAQAWKTEVASASPDRQLVYFYVCNDVLQSGRKKAPEYNAAFGKVLPEALRAVSESVDSKLFGKFDRTLKVWIERHVFDAAFVAQLRQALAGGAGTPMVSAPQQSPSMNPGQLDVSDEPLRSENDLEEPLGDKALQILEEARQLDKLRASNSSERAAAQETLDKEEKIQGGSKANLEAASSRVAKLKGSIQAEVQDRQAFIRTLETLLEQQQTLLDDLSADADQAANMLGKINDILQTRDFDVSATDAANGTLPGSSDLIGEKGNPKRRRVRFEPQTPPGTPPPHAYA
eukprot:Clim_evm13s136 gene=Clim_evmTU13s136